jgi:hypothetical protein
MWSNMPSCQMGGGNERAREIWRDEIDFHALHHTARLFASGTGDAKKWTWSGIIMKRPTNQPSSVADLRHKLPRMSRTSARASNVRRSAVHVVKKKIGHFANGVMWGKCTP